MTESLLSPACCFYGLLKPEGQRRLLRREWERGRFCRYPLKNTAAPRLCGAASLGPAGVQWLLPRQEFSPHPFRAALRDDMGRCQLRAEPPVWTLRQPPPILTVRMSKPTGVLASLRGASRNSGCSRCQNWLVYRDPPPHSMAIPQSGRAGVALGWPWMAQPVGQKIGTAAGGCGSSWSAGSAADDISLLARKERCTSTQDRGS